MVLRQALSEKVRPVLLINKMDKGISKMHEPEDFYKQCVKIINEVNFIISEFIPEEEYKIDPSIGNVAFGSGYFGWAFTIKTFAKIYSKINKVEVDYLNERLWGDCFYDGKKFTKSFDDVNQENDRAFNKFIIAPLIKFQNSIMAKDQEVIRKMMKKFDVEIKESAFELPEEDLLKLIFKKWINAAQAILDMAIAHLPSPKEAQKYRMGCLFKGVRSTDRKSSSEEETEKIEEEEDKIQEEDKTQEQEESEEETKENADNDIVLDAMENCDPEGPTMVFISKLFPVGQNFVALGRIFSGTIKVGDKVKIYNAEDKKPQTKVIKKVSICMGKDVESIGEMPCGNIVVLGGVDSAIKKEATIMSEGISASRFKAMKFSVSPVVEVAVKCVKPTDQDKLVNGLKKLSQSDPLVRVETKESGEIVIAGSGDLHVDI
jgi:elongation factor 2